MPYFQAQRNNTFPFEIVYAKDQQQLVQGGWENITEYNGTRVCKVYYGDTEGDPNDVCFYCEPPPGLEEEGDLNIGHDKWCLERHNSYVRGTLYCIVSTSQPNDGVIELRMTVPNEVGITRLFSLINVEDMILFHKYI